MAKLLAPAGSLYGLAVRVRAAAYARGMLRVQSLRQPVVCVGNLTVGGTGKTPLVAAVTRILVRRGFKPGILTRGYGRERGRRLIALPPAARREPDARSAGDEPALLARALPEIPLVICGDRYRGGRFAEEKFGVNVHVLDDGFQHLALGREIDIVAVDVTQPLFEDALLPAGRLREPPSALRRAHLIVLTRLGVKSAELLKARLRAVNATLQIFEARTELRELLDAASGNAVQDEAWRGRRVEAFCGIGNPGAFLADLGRWGFNVTTAQSFPDHHRYTHRELGVLAREARQSGADALMTTEKDLMNLPAGWRSEVPLLVCRIESQFTEPEKFEQTLVCLLAKTRPRIPAPGEP